MCTVSSRLRYINSRLHTHWYLLEASHMLAVVDDEEQEHHAVEETSLVDHFHTVDSRQRLYGRQQISFIVCHHTLLLISLQYGGILCFTSVFRSTSTSSVSLFICMSICLSTRSLSDLKIIRCVGRGWWVIRDDMVYDPIQGQGQGHGGPKCAKMVDYSLSPMSVCM